MHCSPRVARKASTNGPRSPSSHEFRIPGPRTVHAGRLPAGPWLGLRAMLTGASSGPSASGAAKGGTLDPTVSPPGEPGRSVRSACSDT